MAIIIPSKNIYGNPTNAKIRDNIVDNVNVELTKIQPNNNFDTPVYNLKVDNITWARKERVYNIKGATHLITGSSVSYEIGTYIEITPYITYLNINIPRLLVNEFINELILGKNSNNNFNVSISISYDVEETPASASFYHDTFSGESRITGFSYGTTTSRVETKSFTEFTNEELTQSFTDSLNNSISASVATDFNTRYYNEAYGILGNKNFIETENDFSFDISFMSGYEKITFSGESPLDYGDWWQIEGTRTKYIPTQFTVTIYGNTIGISLTDGTVTYGSGNHPHSLSGNELMQDSAKTNETLTSEFLANRVLEQYKNGKETARILCSVGEYKNDTGELAISTKSIELPMSFNEGDLVTPMKLSSNGEDVPMSRYKDGTSKQFEVVKVNFIYDGATCQELTLQEYTKGE